MSALPLMKTEIYGRTDNTKESKILSKIETVGRREPLYFLAKSF